MAATRHLLSVAAMPAKSPMETICEKGRHQNCIHTRMAEKRKTT